MNAVDYYDREPMPRVSPYQGLSAFGLERSTLSYLELTGVDAPELCEPRAELSWPPRVRQSLPIEGSGLGNASSRSEEDKQRAREYFAAAREGVGARATVCFTDGSSVDNYCGSGAVVKHPMKREIEISVSIGRSTSIAAELYAIQAALDQCLSDAATVIKNDGIHVFSDSQTALGMVAYGWSAARGNHTLVSAIETTMSSSYQPNQ